MLRALQI